MKKFLVIANWKDHAVKPTEWFDEIANCKLQIANLEVAIAPRAEMAPLVSRLITQHTLTNFSLAVQDPMEIKNNNPKYVLVGHSEWRQKLSEGNPTVFQKYSQTAAAGFIPIICAQNEAEIPPDVTPETIIMYEPATAISEPGNYHPEDPEKAKETVTSWRKKYDVPILYGGSVNSQNVKNYLTADGFVIGQASLNPEEFGKILKALTD